MNHRMIFTKKHENYIKRGHVYQVHIVIMSPRYQYVVKSATFRISSKFGVVFRIVAVRVFFEILL